MSNKRMFELNKILNEVNIPENETMLSEGFLDTIKDMQKAAKLGKELPVIMKSIMSDANSKSPEEIKSKLNSGLLSAVKKIESSGMSEDMTDTFKNSFLNSVYDGLLDALDISGNDLDSILDKKLVDMFSWARRFK